MPLQQPDPSTGSPADAGGGNLFGFFFAPPPAPELGPSDKHYETAARECVARCRISALFDDSKFLSQPALRELVAAVASAAVPASVSSSAPGSDSQNLDGVMTGSGPVEPLSAGGGRLTVKDLESAEACLELLMKLAIRNRDRIQVCVCPHMHVCYKAEVADAGCTTSSTADACVYV